MCYFGDDRFGTVRGILEQMGYEQPLWVGQGSFARVYRMREKKTGEWVACKVMTQRELAVREKNFLRGIQQNRIKQEGIPEFRGYVEKDNICCILMEYIWGMELGDYVRRRKGVSVERATEIAIRLARILQFLHERREPVIYRDLKPENVRIRQDGSVCLIDFGCIEILHGEAADDAVSVRERAGTVGYAEPEQLETGVAVVESDVYALGRILWFLLTGKERVPVRRETVCLDGKAAVPEVLYRAICHALEPCRRNRIQDMASFIRALKGKGEKQLWYYEKNIMDI